MGGVELPAAGGAEVQLLGTTRLGVRHALERALADLPVRPSDASARR